MAKKNASGPVDIRFDGRATRTEKLIGQLDKRFKSYAQQLMMATMEKVKDSIVGALPKGRKYTSLIKSIAIAEVNNKNSPSYSVFIDNRARGIKKIDSMRTVIYVRARRGPTPVKPEIQILVDRGPWTTETIPFWPSAKDAIMHQRKVDARTIDRVSKMQDKQKTAVAKEMSALSGSPLAAGAKKKFEAMRAKAIPDVMYEMLSIEYGGGGQRANPAWRKTIQQTPQMLKSLIGNQKRLSQTLSDPGYSAWNTVKKTKRISMSQVRSFTGFMKKIGL